MPYKKDRREYYLRNYKLKRNGKENINLHETIFPFQTRKDRIVAFKAPAIIVAYPSIILPPDLKKEKKNICQRC